MINIAKKNKELFILIGILLALAICVEFPSWLKGGYFVGGGDIKTQWYPFYALNRRETIDAIKGGTLPFYSWILFLGNNIWASKMTYGFVDIFNLMFYLCKENYFWIYDFQVILKILVAGITFYLLIDYVLNNKKAALFAGVLYASSSYLIYFTSQAGFMSFVSLAPLYILGIVKCIKENKKILFIISTAILFLTNYYLFFSLTILSPFIYLYCYYNINNSFNGCLKNIIKIIFYYLVGFLITGIFTIPSFLYLLQNSRVGAFTGNALSYSNIKVYLNIIFSMFTPSQLLIYGNNIFDFSEHTLKELCLFSSSLMPIAIFNFFNSSNTKLKKSSLLMFVLFLLILFTPLLGSILNGFSEVCFRWTFLLIMFEIFLSTYAVFIDTHVNKKTMLFFVIVCSLLVLGTFFFELLRESASISDYSIELGIIVVSIIFMFLYYFSFCFNKKLIFVLLSIELLTLSIFGNHRNLSLVVNNDDINNVNNVLSDIGGETLKEHLSYIDDNEGVFFRTYVDYDDLYWSFSRNMNLLYGFEGVMSYDSTFESSFSDMLGISEKGIVKDINWEYSIDDPDLLDFASCKYALTLTEESIPFKEFEIIEPNYRGGIIISKNLNYKSIGETYSKRISNTDNFKELNNSIISNDKEIDQYLLSNTKNELKDVYYYNNQLEGKVNSDDKSFMVLKLSYDDGFNVFVNNNKVKTYKCNGGMIGFPIEKGENIINVSFTPKGFKLGFICSIIGLVIFIYLLFNKKIIGLIKRQHNN